MDALGCMQMTSSSSSDSSVQFTQRSAYPQHASLVCKIGSFYMWWVNCEASSIARAVAYPDNVTINHLYFVSSNPPRNNNPESSTSILEDIEPVELTLNTTVTLSGTNTGVATYRVYLTRSTAGIICTSNQSFAFISLQFVIA